MEFFFKIVSVFLVAVFKFWLSFPAAKLAGFTFLQSFLVTASGGITGFFLFYFFSRSVFRFFNWIGKKFKRVLPLKIYFFGKPKSNSIFSPRSRWFSKVFSRFGLWGLAFLSPSLISIPIGSTIAANLSGKYNKNKLKVMAAFSLAVVFWAAVFNGVVYFLF